MLWSMLCEINSGARYIVVCFVYIGDMVDFLVLYNTFVCQIFIYQFFYISASSSGASGNTNTNSNKSTGQTNTPSFPETVIKPLMDLGFPREDVIKELTLSNGNSEQAMAALFAKSLIVPDPPK